MKSILVFTALLAATYSSGCYNAPPAEITAQAPLQQPPSSSGTGPLSVEEWRGMQGELKYAPTTLERLKKHDRSLRTRAGWNKFVEEVLRPEIRRESGSIAQSS